MAPIYDGVGMIMAVFSLCGRLSIGITACADALADVAGFEQMLEDSLAELEGPPAVPLDAPDSKLALRGRRAEVAALHDASESLAAAIERLDRSLDEEE